MSIENTLAERGARYGDFKEHAAIAQDIQDAMRKSAGWEKLAPDQKQALTVVADKIARMLNGDPNYIDNWHDIIGYAKLVEARLLAAQPAPEASVAFSLEDAELFQKLIENPGKPNAALVKAFNKRREGTTPTMTLPSGRKVCGK